jgi:hypothetical protein
MIDPAELAGIIRDQVAREVSQRMDGLRSALELSIKTIQPGADGRHGIDGKDGAPGRDGEKGLDGKDGRDGLQGKDGAAGAKGDPGEKGDRGDQGPQGEPGKPGDPGQRGEKGDPGLNGKDGADGVNGRDGADGIDGKDGAPGREGQKGADGINGKDGRDGVDGKDGSAGIQGKDGAPGRDGEKGADGKSIEFDDVREYLDGQVAKALLEIERRAGDALQKAIDRTPAPRDGKDGADGRDGVDGVGFDDVRVEFDGERAFAVVFERGGVRKEFAFSLPTVIDRGVYDAAKIYERGDAFTYAGSTWITQRKSKPGEKPGDESGAFRLAAPIIPIETLRAQCELVAIQVDTDVESGESHPDDPLLLGLSRGGGRVRRGLHRPCDRAADLRDGAGRLPVPSPVARGRHHALLASARRHRLVSRARGRQ